MTSTAEQAERPAADDLDEQGAPPENSPNSENLEAGQGDEAREDPANAEAEGEEQRDRRPRGGFQRRISQLTSQIHELQAENRTLRELGFSEQGDEPDKPAAKEPRRDDYESYEDYLEARQDYLVEKRIQEADKQRTEREQSKRVEEEQRALSENWADQVIQGREKYDDFDDIALADELPVTAAMGQAVQAAENGAEILYHLGKNPKEADRIAKLPPLKAVIEIGKLEAKLLADGVRPRSKAPRPINPSPTGRAPSNSLSDEASTKAWIAERQKQRRPRK